jgi:DNA-binding transcriptional ArsR family regulator
MTRVMDLTQRGSRLSVEVRSCVPVDLLVSILTYHSPESAETYDTGRTWFEEVERRMSSELRETLGRIGPVAIKNWAALAGIALEAGDEETLEGFLARLEGADAVEIWLAFAGFHLPSDHPADRATWERAAQGDAAAREAVEASVPADHVEEWLGGMLGRRPDEAKRDVVEALRLWRRDVYAEVEDEMALVLRRDAESKRAMARSMTPERLIETACDGLEYTPQPWMKAVTLVPHIAMRPWNVMCGHDERMILIYPAAEESLDHDVTAPPETLLRLHKALGDEKRLRMLKMLARSSRTLQELADGVGLAKSSAHHHTVILRAAGLVRVTAEEESRYTLRRDVLPEASAMLERFLGGER